MAFLGALFMVSLLCPLDLDYPTGFSFVITMDFKDYHGLPVS